MRKKNKIDGEFNLDEINKELEEICDKEPLIQTKKLKEIAEVTGLSKGEIKEQLKEIIKRKKKEIDEKEQGEKAELISALKETEKVIVKEDISEEILKKTIKENYEKIIGVLMEYCDLREDHYPIIALWIIGTYLHKEFLTYPYLFFNAMKGSGKTRILKLISYLMNNGKLLVSLSEAVLFRTASSSGFCIDEIERIARQEQATLKELLNAAYKKGLKVERAEKDGDSWIVVGYDVYCPIAMANIWGMEEVLADRCISLTLEKSNNQEITRLLENFEENEKINEIKKELNNVFSVYSVEKVTKSLYRAWNIFIHNYQKNIFIKNNIPPYTNRNNTNYTDNRITNDKSSHNLELFDKIYETSLDSRHLELFFPLLILADFCSVDVLTELLETAQNIVKEKKAEDVVESKDVALIDYLSKKAETKEYQGLSELTASFKEYLEEDDENAKWTNSRWLGRALKRLNLIKDKRRVGKGIEVVVNYDKAREKIKMFREIEPEPPKPTPPATEKPEFQPEDERLENQQKKLEMIEKLEKDEVEEIREVEDIGKHDQTCLKCGNDFEAWGNEKYCDGCDAGEEG